MARHRVTIKSAKNWHCRIVNHPIELASVVIRLSHYAFSKHEPKLGGNDSLGNSGSCPQSFEVALFWIHLASGAA
jgi:hypothetical protein